jgi:predicted dehydrogenase
MQNGDSAVIRVAEQSTTGVIDAFVHALQGEKDCVLAAQRILPSMRAMFAAVRSANTGERVRLKDLP